MIESERYIVAHANCGDLMSQGEFDGEENNLASAIAVAKRVALGEDEDFKAFVLVKVGVVHGVRVEQSYEEVTGPAPRKKRTRKKSPAPRGRRKKAS